MSILERLKKTFKKKEEVTEETLRLEQEEIDKLYAKDGLTDEVLEKQVALNGKRNEMDIPDARNLVDGWSQ